MLRYLVRVLASAIGLALAFTVAYLLFEGYRLHLFQRIRIGMTQAEVLAILGDPTRSGSKACIEETQCSGTCWLYRQRILEHLVISFDASGRVECRDTFRPETRASG